MILAFLIIRENCIELELGINCEFASNKYLEPEEYIRIVSEELEMKHEKFDCNCLIRCFYENDSAD